MAEWIAWHKGLPQKTEVIQIAKALKVTRREAACMCMEVWEWSDEQTADGFIPGLSPTDVSDVVGIRGIGEAMADVGWLVIEAGGIELPNWERWNSDSAKRRMQQSRWIAKRRTADGRSQKSGHSAP